MLSNNLHSSAVFHHLASQYYLSLTASDFHARTQYPNPELEESAYPRHLSARRDP